MEKPVILITNPMSPEYVAKLNSDPRVKKAQQLPREMWPLFRDIFNMGEKGATVDPGPMKPYLAEADIICSWGLPHGWVPKWTPRLKWMQAWSAGADHVRECGVYDAGIPVTNMAGIHAIPIAEHVLMLMLMLARNARTLGEMHSKRQWRPRPQADELYGKTVGVVGLGAIGGRVAEVCRGMGMRVLATRRTATRRQRNVHGLDELLPPSDLHSLLAQSDYVVLSCPLTKETEGLIGEKELRAMKPTAFLVNIARGEVVDEAALKRALRERWFAGAGLDVFWNEPLEQESELWGLPNVIITPHNAGHSPRQEERAAAIFEDNLARFLSGRPFTHLVDPTKGY
ncbi:MAG: D-2-hydroxyacid dehydrogenase [Chloroflexi bacterium]|nr:D-2-hydroxyacid dehydrogenase [Chloroflexota bacterium]